MRAFLRRGRHLVQLSVIDLDSSAGLLDEGNAIDEIESGILRGRSDEDRNRVVPSSRSTVNTCVPSTGGVAE